jgi:hypothetical protein
MPHVGNWKAVAKKEEAVRERARALYLDKRDDLAAIIVRELEPDLREADVKNLADKVVRWMTAWEIPERQAKRRAVANLAPERRLGDFVVRVEKFKANLELAEMAQELQQTESNARNVAHWFRLWTEAMRQLLEVEAEMTASEDRDKIVDPYWAQAKQRIYKRILRDYHGKGEIYRSLCDRLASVQVALMRLEEQGRMETSIYQALQEQFTSLAAQVQRHTEATKVELTETYVQEVGERFLKLVEPLLYNQPALLDRLYAAIEGNMGNIIDGKVLQLPERIPA